MPDFRLLSHCQKIITLWKSSNLTPATAPLTRDAMALQASPTKSGTLKILAASLSSALSVMSKCLKIQGNSVIIKFHRAFLLKELLAPVRRSRYVRRHLHNINRKGFRKKRTNISQRR